MQVSVCPSISLTAATVTGYVRSPARLCLHPFVTVHESMLHLLRKMLAERQKATRLMSSHFEVSTGESAWKLEMGLIWTMGENTLSISCITQQCVQRRRVRVHAHSQLFLVYHVATRHTGVCVHR